MPKTTEEMIEELRDIKLRAMTLSAELGGAEMNVTKNLNFLREKQGKLSGEEFKKLWEETKVQIIECEKHRREWMKLQLRLIEIDKELKQAEAVKVGISRPTLH
jgi:hypothetical protein